MMQPTAITPAGLRVSKIGLGCVTFGREIDEAAAHGLLDHAYARGIMFFDTASAYAQGASESIIGRWIASRRPATGSVTVATKILPPYEPARVVDSQPGSRFELVPGHQDVCFHDEAWQRLARLESVAAQTLNGPALFAELSDAGELPQQLVKRAG